MTPITAYTTDSTNALPLYVLDRDGFAAWKAQQPAAVQAWAAAQQFNAAPNSVLLLPGDNGIAGAVLGVGDHADAYAYAHAPFALPAGTIWQVANALDASSNANLQIGWGLGYIKDRYGNPGKAWDFWKRNHWYANGGFVTKPTVGMIGEAGPELVLPLSRRERTEELLDKAGLSQGKGHTVIVNAAPNVPTEDQIVTKLRHLDMLYG